MVLEDKDDYLPLIRSPLLRPEDGPHRPSEDRATQIDQAELGNSSDEDAKQNDAVYANGETPKFRRFEQATNIELFYDLFFVANLTAFTYVHEVNDEDTLKQYIGFFCIIWFTWYQVSLYDVRFAMDSAFERVCKAVQFLVMIGFAIIGPRFNPGEESTGDGDTEEPHLNEFKALTIILCVSRFMLVVEYLQATWFAKDYKKVVVPMLLISLNYFVASMIYLGLYWSFHLNANGENHSYIAWYVVAVAETVFATAVSVFWRNLSFVGTHLAERMTLLTLIILGEGAIAIAKAVQYISTSEGVFVLLGPVPAMIVCAVLILYFMYMIYMDWIHEGLFGSVRQQIWSFLHFPLHVALVLSVEGVSQSITWNAGVQAARSLLRKIDYWDDMLFLGNGRVANATMFNMAADDFNATSIKLLDVQIGVASDYTSTVSGLANIYQFGISAIPAIRNGTSSPLAAGGAMWWATGTLFDTIFKIAGFKPPLTTAAEDKVLDLFASPIDFSSPEGDFSTEALYKIKKSYELYRLTYIYFFVTMGAYVMLCAVLAALNRGRKGLLFWFRLAVTAAIGLGLALLACLAATDAVLMRFVESDWVLPTVTLALFAIVVLNSIKLTTPRKLKMKTKGRR